VGRTKQDAFDSFKALYNISVTMNFVVFFACCRKFYEWPTTWDNFFMSGFGIVRETVGYEGGGLM
jgi:hypothetical protein